MLILFKIEIVYLKVKNCLIYDKEKIAINLV
jgi:hypothetical protein